MMSSAAHAAAHVAAARVAAAHVAGLTDHERGWPTFEQRLTMLLKMQSSLAWANIVDVAKPNAKVLVPLPPAAFAALLEKRVFTNGAARRFVSKLYEKTINEALSQTTQLRFVKQDWRDKDIAELVQVLPFCAKLQRLALDDNNKLTCKSAQALAQALTEGMAPCLEYLGHEAGHSFAHSKALRDACKERGIKLKRFAGITMHGPAHKKKLSITFGRGRTVSFVERTGEAWM
jgi:hypothetical protein